MIGPSWTFARKANPLARQQFARQSGGVEEDTPDMPLISTESEQDATLGPRILQLACARVAETRLRRHRRQDEARPRSPQADETAIPLPPGATAPVDVSPHRDRRGLGRRGPPRRKNLVP